MPDHRRRIMESFGVFVVAFALIVPAAWTWPGHLEGDENGFVEHGMTLSAAFVEGLALRDFSDPVWDAPLNNYGCYNPRVGAYLLGALGHATHAMPEKARVRTQRVVAAVWTAMCVSLLFGLVRTTGSLGSGLVAAALFLAHPAFRSLKVALLPDVPMMLFSLVSLLFLARFAVSSSPVGRARQASVRQYALLLGFGLFAGLAASCKLYACTLFLVLPVAVWSHRQHMWTTLLWLAGACGIAATIFVASNPMLYSQPLAGARMMTSGHLGVWVGYEPGFDAVSAFRATRALFGLCVPLHVDVRTDLYVLSRLYVLPGSSLLVGTLFAIGCVVAACRRRFLTLAWAASSFGLLGYVLSRFPAEMLFGHPRMLILPTVALVWVIAGIDHAALRASLRAIRDRGLPTRRVPNRSGPNVETQ